MAVTDMERTLIDRVNYLEAENGKLREDLDFYMKEVAATHKAQDRLRATLDRLVKRLDEIHDNPAYKSVWTINQLHCGEYKGPTYTDELDAARRALGK